MFIYWGCVNNTYGYANLVANNICCDVTKNSSFHFQNVKYEFCYSSVIDK